MCVAVYQADMCVVVVVDVGFLRMSGAYTRLLQSPPEAKDSSAPWHLEGLDHAYR